MTRPHYGIDQITSDIESVSTENLANLFKGVSKDDIMRPAGPVDVLIGYEYAAYHPQRMQNVWTPSVTPESI